MMRWATGGWRMPHMPAPDGAFDTAGDRAFLLGLYSGITFTVGTSIDGETTQVIVFQYDAIEVQSNGTNWDIR